MSTRRIPRRSCVHDNDFTRWSQGHDAPREFGAQHCAAELLGEHHLMDLAFDAILASARQPEPVDENLAFWRDAVDFIGNFVLRCHRAKEDDVFFPALIRAQILGEECAATKDDRLEARRLTFGIRDGVRARDWARVGDSVPNYVLFMRGHMMTEERALLQPYARSLGAKLEKEIADEFQEIEKTACPKRDRQSYIDVTRRLCEQTGIEHRL